MLNRNKLSIGKPVSLPQSRIDLTQPSAFISLINFPTVAIIHPLYVSSWQGDAAPIAAL